MEKYLQYIKRNYLKVILGGLLCIVTVLVVVAYFLFKVPLPKSSVVLDPVTRKPIPEAQVNAIRQKQAAELRATVTTGKVVGKSHDSIQVEVHFSERARILDIALVPRPIFLAAVQVEGATPFATEEKNIEFADIQIGNRVTLLSNEGIFVNQTSMEKVTVNKIIVHDYSEKFESKD